MRLLSGRRTVAALGATSAAALMLSSNASADLGLSTYGSSVYWNAAQNSLLITDTVRDGYSAVGRISYGGTVLIFRNANGYGTVKVSSISLPAGSTRVAISACRKDYGNNGPSPAAPPGPGPTPDLSRSACQLLAAGALGPCTNRLRPRSRTTVDSSATRLSWRRRASEAITGSALLGANRPVRGWIWIDSPVGRARLCAPSGFGKSPRLSSKPTWSRRADAEGHALLPKSGRRRTHRLVAWVNLGEHPYREPGRGLGRRLLRPSAACSVTSRTAVFAGMGLKMARSGHGRAVSPGGV